MEIRINISKKNVSKRLDELDDRVFEIGQRLSRRYNTEIKSDLNIGKHKNINYVIFTD